MTSLAQYDIVVIAIALLVGLIVAYWAFRRRDEPDAVEDLTAAPPQAQAPAPPRPARLDGAEGNSPRPAGRAGELSRARRHGWVRGSVREIGGVRRRS